MLFSSAQFTSSPMGTSFINIDVIDLCRSNGVILFCLHPQTIHALQPLDVAVFKSLKDVFSKTVRALSFMKKNVVKRPLEQVFSIPNVKAGFAKSGIYLFNPDAIAKHKMIPSSLHGSFSSSDSESSSLYPSSVSESPNPLSQAIFTFTVASSTVPANNTDYCSTSSATSTLFILLLDPYTLKML